MIILYGKYCFKYLKLNIVKYLFSMRFFFIECGCLSPHEYIKDENENPRRGAEKIRFVFLINRSFYAYQKYWFYAHRILVIPETP